MKEIAKVTALNKSLDAALEEFAEVEKAGKESLKVRERICGLCKQLLMQYDAILEKLHPSQDEADTKISDHFLQRAMDVTAVYQDFFTSDVAQKAVQHDQLV